MIICEIDTVNAEIFVFSDKPESPAVYDRVDPVSQQQHTPTQYTTYSLALSVDLAGYENGTVNDDGVAC